MFLLVDHSILVPTLQMNVEINESFERLNKVFLTKLDINVLRLRAISTVELQYKGIHHCIKIDSPLSGYIKDY